MSRPSRPWFWEDRQGWYVTVRGKRRKLAEGPRSKSKAAADREFHRLMVAEGRGVEVGAGRMTCRDLFNLYLASVADEVSQGTKEGETLNSYTKHLVSASKGFGAVRVVDVMVKDVLGWANRPSWGPTMRNTALSVVKAAFAWGKRVGHLQVNPLDGLPLPRPRVREAIPTHEQVEVILRSAWGQPFRDLIMALRETGCRPSEVSTLTVDRVDLGAGTWQVKNKTRHATGRAWRTVYLSEGMVELSRRLIEGRAEGLVFRNSRGEAWRKGPIAYRFIRLRRRLGYGPECTAYAFRHLYITDALERGVNPATVAELVGHASLTYIMRTYSKLRHRTGHLSDAARLVIPPSPSPPR
jgi:integrase